MMRKTMVLAMFMLVAAAVIASPDVSRTRHDSVVKSIEIKGGPKPNRDTDTVAESYISSRNLIFKQRLDSIQTTVPLTYNSYVQEYIDIYMSRTGQIGKMLGLSKYYFPIYEKIFRDNDIPQEIKFLSIVESSLDPHAVSRSGATGLWQFMSGTAKGYGLNIDNYSDDRKDPIAASTAATKYFKEAFGEFGDWLLAIAAYNCGTGAVSRAIAKAGGVKDFWAIRNYLPLQTRNYVPAFIATTYMMSCYMLHDISPAPADFPSQTDVIQVNRFVSLENIAKAIDIDIEKLYILNPSYKKKIINGTPDTPKSLIIPVSDKNNYEGLYNALNIAEEPRVILTKERSTSRHAMTSPVYHKVKKGENLSIIANRYGVEVMDLMTWNNLKNLLIKPGQVLQVSANKSA
ncbi:MAG TPA: lytic transglycosylase [Sphingobacteriaceae bacterium]|nr:lytic transglycosylase [Sphingobacteriaceae bacterium]